jgi:rhomboid protease GluP
VNRDYQQPDYPTRPDDRDYGWGREEPPTPPRTAQVKAPSVSPIVTYSIMGITVLVFIGQLTSEALLGFDLLAAVGMKINQAIAQGEFWRLITPVFLHGSLLHIGFNMYALYIFGPGLERHFGHLRFLGLYFLAGFAGNVASMMFSIAPSLGSSTAIFGLLGAQGVFLYQNKDVLGGFARRALNNILMIAVVNLFIGLSPGIDNWGHMGGLVGGTLFAWFAGPLLQIKGGYPNLSVEDRRETREILLTSFLVGSIFLLLAIWTIYTRSG